MLQRPLDHLLLMLAILCLAGCNLMNGGMNNQVGMSFYKQGNYTMARDEFQRAVANDPNNADYLHNLAMAMRKQGDSAGAEKTFRQAIQSDPSHQPSYHGLARVMTDQGRTPEAIDLVQGWVDQQPYSPEPYIEMAWLKRETGDIAGSEQLLQSALRVKPNDHVATAQLGQLYQDTNQPDRAIAMYRRSLYTNYYQPEVQSRMTQLERQPFARGYGPNTMQAYAPGGYPQPMAQASPRYSLPSYSHVAPQQMIVQQPIGPQQVIVQQPIGPPATTVQADPAHATEQLSGALPAVAPH